MLHYTPFSKKGISILAASTLSVSFLAFAPSATATEIDDGLVDSIVAANTKSPSPSTGEKWVPNDGSLKINEGSLLPQQDSITTPAPSKNAGTKTKLIEREDGNQLVSVSDGDAPLELSFEFSDSFLEKLPSGHILVRPAEGEEPSAYTEPAWAKDVDGNEINTHFSIDGDKIIQHISSSPAGKPVISDPYIRDVHGWGKKIGQELVFSKDETSGIAIGTAYCAGKIAGVGLGSWVAKGACAGASAVAAHATNTGRCLTIRALGSSPFEWCFYLSIEHAV